MWTTEKVPTGRLENGNAKSNLYKKKRILKIVITIKKLFS